MKNVAKDINVLSIGNGGMKATISESKLSKLFELLQSPYSDPIASIVRETSTNAWDAHVEAGVVEPILITFDIDLNSGYYIEFTDYGVGMSPERIEKVYVNYLESTKEDSNEQSGYFGIGSKSPLSYSDDYYITTKFDGIEYQYIIRKDSDGIPIIELLDEFETTSGNGTSIKLYIKNSSDVYKFAEACNKQLKYFEHVYFNNNSGLVLNLNNDFKIIKGDYFVCRVIPSANNQSLYEYINVPLDLTIGQVRYPLNNELIIEMFGENKRGKIEKIINHLSGFSLKIPIGLVSITMTRENIKYNNNSKENIKNILIKAYREIFSKNIYKNSLIFKQTTSSLEDDFIKFFDSINNNSDNNNFSISHDVIPIKKSISYSNKISIHIPSKPDILFKRSEFNEYVSNRIDKSIRLSLYKNEFKLEVKREDIIKEKLNIFNTSWGATKTLNFYYSSDNSNYRLFFQDLLSGRSVQNIKRLSDKGYNRVAFIEDIRKNNTFLDTDIGNLIDKCIDLVISNLNSEKKTLSSTYNSIFVNHSHGHIPDYDLNKIIFKYDVYVECLIRNYGESAYNIVSSSKYKNSVKIDTLKKFMKKHLVIGFRKSLQQDTELINFYHKFSNCFNQSFIILQVDEANEKILTDNGIPTVSSIIDKTMMPDVRILKKYRYAFNQIYGHPYSTMNLYEKTKYYDFEITKVRNAHFNIKGSSVTKVENSLKEYLFEHYPHFNLSKEIDKFQQFISEIIKINDIVRTSDLVPYLQYKLLKINYFTIKEVFKSKELLNFKFK
jgi:hypothetical protein